MEREMNRKRSGVAPSAPVGRVCLSPKELQVSELGSGTMISAGIGALMITTFVIVLAIFGFIVDRNKLQNEVDLAAISAAKVLQAGGSKGQACGVASTMLGDEFILAECSVVEGGVYLFVRQEGGGGWLGFAKGAEAYASPVRPLMPMFQH